MSAVTIGHLMPVGEGGVGKTTLIDIINATIAGNTNIARVRDRTPEIHLNKMKLYNPNPAANEQIKSYEYALWDLAGNPEPSVIAKQGSFMSTFKNYIYVIEGTTEKFETSVKSLSEKSVKVQLADGSEQVKDGRWFELINRFSLGAVVKPKATYLSKILTDESIATINNGVPDVRDLDEAIDFAMKNGSDYFFTGDAFGGSNGTIKPKMWALKNRELVETSILAPYSIPAIEVAKSSKSRTPFEIPDSVFNYIEQFKLRR